MLTYEQISAATLESVKTAARTVETEVTLVRGNFARQYVGKAWSGNGGSRYAVKVEASGRFLDQIWCYCACPYFRYHCEYVLAHAGSSRLIAAKDIPPSTTNPESKPMVCKHVWAVLEKLREISLP